MCEKMSKHCECDHIPENILRWSKGGPDEFVPKQILLGISSLLRGTETGPIDVQKDVR